MENDSGTFGPAYDKNIDEPALSSQRNRIKHWLLPNDHLWFTLAELSVQLGYPEASISAQLRHLRKPQFGGYLINKRRRKNQRAWEYNLRIDSSMLQQMLIPEQKKIMDGH